MLADLKKQINQEEEKEDSPIKTNPES